MNFHLYPLSLYPEQNSIMGITECTILTKTRNTNVFQVTLALERVIDHHVRKGPLAPASGLSWEVNRLQILYCSHAEYKYNPNLPLVTRSILFAARIDRVIKGIQHMK